MPQLTIDYAAGEFNVWLALTEGDPVEQAESMVLGVGHSEAAALRDAADELRKLLEAIEHGQVPAVQR